MSKRSFLRKSAVSLAATLGLGGTIAFGQVNIPPNATGNSSDAGPSSLGNQTVTFTAPGGMLTLNGTGVLATNKLQQRWFDDEFGTAMLNPISNLIAATSEGSNELIGELNYRGDAGFNAPGVTVGLTDLETYSGLWTGFMTITTPGDYGFATGSDDGSVFWIDLNNDGTFGGGELVVDLNFDTGYQRTPTRVRNLAAGRYPIAIGFYENGGGNDMEALIQRPGGTLDFINPAAASQAGMWSYISNVSNNANFTTNPIALNASGTIFVDPGKSIAATVGAVSMARGTTLTVDGANLNTPSTTLTGAGAAVTFAGTGNFNAGTFNAGATPVDIVKSGTGSVRFPRVSSTVAAGSTLAVNGGTFAIGMGATTTSVGSAPIALNGGTLGLVADPLSINGPGHFGTVGQFYLDADVFNPMLAQDSTNTFGWSGLDSKTQLDAKLNARTPLATRDVNLPINFPRGDGNPANGGTNDIAEGVFNVDGANLGVGLTGSGPNSLFAARFTGKLNVTTAGPTPITLLSNDGAVMFIDMDLGAGQNWQKVVDNNRFSTTGGGVFQGRESGNASALDGGFAVDAGGPAIPQPAVPNLAVGQYDYIVGTFNAAENEYGIELFWTPPGGTRTLIPFAGELPTFNLTNALTVSGNSGLTVERPTTLASLTMNPGGSLAVSGSQLTTAVTATGPGTVSIGGAASGPPVRLTTLSDGGSAVVFAAGSGRAMLTNVGGPGAGFGATSSVGAVTGGTLVVTNTATGNTLGTAPVTLAGGTLELNVAAIEGTGFVAGLREGRVAGNFNITDPNPFNRGILLEPIRAQVVGSGNVEPFPDNTTYIYTGQMLFPANSGGQSQFAFAECFDDSTQIKIDGVERLNNGAWDVANTTGVLTLPAGWHDVEFRFGEGGGGWGPSGQNGWVQNPAPGIAPGFGVDFTLPIDPSDPPLQAEFARPVDNGTMNVFRTAAFLSPTFASNVTATDNSKINVTGASTATIGNLSVSDGKTLSVLGNGLTAGNVTTGAGGMLTFSGGASKITGSLNGAGTVQATKSFALEFTGSGAASTGSSKLDIATLANMKFAPGAGNTFQGSTVSAISNEGLLHVPNGTVDLSGATMTTTNTSGFVPGLLEGRLSGSFNITDPNPGTSPNPAVGGIKLEPVLAQLSGAGNIEPWPDNTTHVYTGQILIPDNGTPGDGQGSFAMAEHFDDNTQIKIDGVERLNNTAWDVANTTGVLTLPAGWHDLELRFGEGGGGWGPSTSMTWTNTLGFGIDFTVPIDPSDPPLQSEFVRPVDDGTGNLFRFFNPPVENVRVDAGATLKLGAVRGTNIVNVDGRLELHGDTSKMQASGLKIAGTPAAPTATLDLTDSAIALEYAAGDPNPAPDVRTRIIAGRGTPGLIGSWDGKGITSSTSAAAPDTTSVGYAVNADMPLGAVTTFRGVTVDPTTVLIRHTRIGDANLDGVVNDDDVTIVGATYAPGVANASWANGDFDYNGFVDDDDVTLLGALYNPSAPPIPAPDGSGGVAAVPEPATWLMLTLGGLGAGLFGWRRRKSSK